MHVASEVALHCCHNRRCLGGTSIREGYVASARVVRAYIFKRTKHQSASDTYIRDHLPKSRRQRLSIELKSGSPDCAGSEEKSAPPPTPASSGTITNHPVQWSTFSYPHSTRSVLALSARWQYGYRNHWSLLCLCFRFYLCVTKCS